MGSGNEILRLMSYVPNFFTFTEEIDQKLSSTIKKARAFIVPEFQQKSMLFLFWRGVATVTVKYPAYKYLMGDASINNFFCDYSKSMSITFLYTYYSNKEVRKFIKFKNPYKVDLPFNEGAYLKNIINRNVKKLDKSIKEVEAGKLCLPFLIKQYIKQNAKFVVCNQDANFNDAIDALIFMKIARYS